MFVITAMLGLFISNTATAVLIAPVAMAIAKDLGDWPYSFDDFVKVGVPFTIIVAIVSALLVPIFLPLQ